MKNFTRTDLTVDEKIEEPGSYSAKVLSAHYDDTKKMVNVKIKSDGKYIDYIKFYTVKKNGEPNTYAYNQINELLTLARIDNITLEGNKYIELTNVEVGILVDIVENEGHNNLQLISFFDLNSDQTAYELHNNLKATRLEKKIKILEAKYA